MEERDSFFALDQHLANFLQTEVQSKDETLTLEAIRAILTSSNGNLSSQNLRNPVMPADFG